MGFEPQWTTRFSLGMHKTTQGIRVAGGISSRIYAFLLLGIVIPIDKLVCVCWVAYESAPTNNLRFHTNV